MSGRKKALKRPYSPPQMHTFDDEDDNKEEETKPLTALLNYCQAIKEEVQRLTHKTDVLDEKVTQLQNYTRDCWNSIATLPLYKPDGECAEETESSTVTIENSQKPETQETASTPESPEHTPSSYFHSQNSQKAYSETSESDLNSSATCIVYYDQSYVESGAASPAGAARESSDHSQVLDMVPKDPRTYRSDPDNLRSIELIPIMNPEMRRLALLEAQRTPPCDPTSDTENILSQCNLAIMDQLYIGDPTTWTVEDVMKFLYQVDPPLADHLFRFIQRYNIDGNALLLLTTEKMVKSMKMSLGVARRLCAYIDRLNTMILLYK